ncbi:TIGR03084 family metal-binding protein [Nocardioides speluncae]|uniref:TIGR03084 family metal-binding protein n=1 Tax=Nocardioides speluncae TaxID=2670337 RepID=UPI000D69814C|nr:TIGR03084 family metal-binding protein [Nocardioides speluncae]
MNAPLEDLDAEGDALDALVDPLTAEQLALPTPAAGWTIGHQLGHLAWTDEVALIALRDADAFQAEIAAAMANPDTHTDSTAAERAALPSDELLARWRAGRAELSEALRALPRGARIPWFGPSMGAASMATARLMETWAHGEDVAEALGVRREPTARLKNVVHLGVITLGFAYVANGLEPPTVDIHVELTAPDGDTWTWGDADAEQRVTGPALDFCLRVTQRRHLDDLRLEAVGPDAETWLSIAQAFAGPPGGGQHPRREVSA